MKRLITLILAFAMLLSVTAMPSFAAEVPDANKLAVTEMGFKNGGAAITAPRAGKTDISCTVEKINKKDGETVSFICFAVVRQKGKIVSSDNGSYSVSGSEKSYPSLQVTIPESTKGVTVEVFFWDSFSGGVSLAPKATLGCTDNSVLAIYADGERVAYTGGDTAEKEFIASLSHQPEIIVIPKDSAAKATVTDIQRFPQNVRIAVKPHSGKTGNVTLRVSLADGTVSDAHMITASGVDKELPVDTFREPFYGEGVEPPVGEEYETLMPLTKTLVFCDRNMYYVSWPLEFNDAVAVQTSMETFRYDALYLKPENALAKMGSFTIDRSANIYLYGGGTLDWAKADGYTSVTTHPITMYYTDYKDRNPNKYNAYKKTVVVPEGETREVRIGSYKTAAGGKADYFFVVDFISPTEVFGVSDLSISGVSDFEFNSSVYEYNIDLAEGVTEIPEISYTLAGIGATAEITGDTAVPGTKTLKVTGATGESVSYTFNFKTFENVLNDIKVNGTSIEGFDKYTMDYTYALPWGWKTEDGFPEITVEKSSFVTADIIPATADTMKTEIKITAELGEPKTYTVTFTETLERPSVETKIALGWNTGIIKDNKNVYSATEQSKATVYTYQTGQLNAFNKAGIRADYVPVVGYMQLDLTKLTGEIDYEKGIYLRAKCKLTMYDKKADNGITFNDAVVSVYDASGFDWTQDLSTRAVAEDLTALDGYSKLANIYANDLTPGADIRVAESAGYDIDITEAVKGWIAEGNMTPTLCFAVDKPTETTNILNRVVFVMSFTTSANMSYIVYNKFE